MSRDKDARAKSTPMLPASIRVCSPGHHAINQLGMPHHWAAPDRLAAALFVSASLRQDGQGGKRVAAASVGRHVPEALFALSEDPGPDFQGTSQPDQGLFDALEESSIAVPDCGTMPWWADAQLCEMSKRCGGACSAWWALGTRALFDGGMVVPGRPLSQCLGKPQVGGGPRPLSLQAPSPLKVRSREDVIPLLQARVTTSG